MDMTLDGTNQKIIAQQEKKFQISFKVQSVSKYAFTTMVQWIFDMNYTTDCPKLRYQTLTIEDIEFCQCHSSDDFYG